MSTPPKATRSWSETSVCVLGCGEVFDALIDDPAGYRLSRDHVTWHRFESVAAVATQADEALSNISANKFSLFVAVDAHAMNHARLELYGRARLVGFKPICLIHGSAVISPSVELADNVWVGPAAVLGRQCKIGSNTFIGAGARLDAEVDIGIHGWIGAGAKLGRSCRIAEHCVIGADSVLKPGTALGHHVAIEQLGPWSGLIAAGTCIETDSRGATTMIGPGYTHSLRGPP